MSSRNLGGSFTTPSQNRTVKILRDHQQEDINKFKGTVWAREEIVNLKKQSHNSGNKVRKGSYGGPF